ncbi:MAG: histidine--tRNA ligase [Planctomycetes bacterium]|nr:histidine--tRNA ligase [Planctomycetota bacterium]MCB9908830.1 histidine--tRNA ligase [Planctomycetota bacterium]
MITPRTLKGFRDYLPEAAGPREALLAIARKVYRSFGFRPIDTPALEYTEILLGKGGEETDKQLYRFEDHGGRDVGLRFDLTVPLARFVAQHAGELGMPFKRYHMGSVWRGENTQRGRYREFLQCDFDTIGTESLVSDVETLLVVHTLFDQIGLSACTLRVNHRGVLAGVLENAGVGAEQGPAVLRALDKLDKIGPEKVAEEMQASAGVDASQAQHILALPAIVGDRRAVLDRVTTLIAGSESGEAGLAILRGVDEGLRAAGVPEGALRFDLSIARGLDYYTGIVVETFLDALPGIGSCCSGGRYDDLASLYTKQRLPGVGASLGVDRLLAALEELKLSVPGAPKGGVFLAFFDAQRGTDYLALAQRLRAGGVTVELYPEPKKLGQQLKYADRRGLRLAIIIGDAEWQAGTAQVKDLATGSSQEVDQADLLALCQSEA